jgi:hypothetical protein
MQKGKIAAMQHDVSFSIRTLLTIETAADLARSVVEYCAYALFFVAIGIGWILT